jgi:hypothetical protein
MFCIDLEALKFILIENFIFYSSNEKDIEIQITIGLDNNLTFFS